MHLSRPNLVTAVAVLALTGGFALQASAQDTAPAARTYSVAEKAVLDAESARFAAQVNHDLAVLSASIADQAIYVHANGQQQTRAEYLHDVEAGTSRYRSIEPSDRTVQFIGNSAITHGAITLGVGVDRTINGRYTGVYIQKDGHWQVVSFQTTIVAPRQ